MSKALRIYADNASRLNHGEKQTISWDQTFEDILEPSRKNQQVDLS